jgi:hypothetical protein
MFHEYAVELFVVKASAALYWLQRCLQQQKRYHQL